MSRYTPENLILSIEPQDVTSEDIALLTMEKNPMDALRYFVSTTDDAPKFKSKLSVIHLETIPQEKVSNKELKEADGAVFAKYFPKENPHFLYFNLLRSTGWLSRLLGVNNKTTIKALRDGKFNSIQIDEQKPFKGLMVIPDEKLQNFVKERQSMKASNVSSPAKMRNSVQDKILSVIKSGVVGGLGDSINAEAIFPHVAAAYPNESWTRPKINAAFGTLMSHGDLVRVPVLDNNGNATGSFAQGKYHINTRTAADYSNTVVPIVPAATAASVVSVPSSTVKHPQKAVSKPSVKPSTVVTVEIIRKISGDKNSLVKSRDCAEVLKKTLGIGYRHSIQRLMDCKEAGLLVNPVRGLWGLPGSEMVIEAFANNSNANASPTSEDHRTIEDMRKKISNIQKAFEDLFGQKA